MKSPDKVFNELGQLYDFYKEIAKFRWKKTVKDPGKTPNVKSPKETNSQ